MSSLTCRMKVESMESEIQRRLKEVLFPARDTLNSALGKSSWTYEGVFLLTKGRGSAFILCGSGSSFSSQCGSRSSCFFNRIRMDQAKKKLCKQLPVPCEEFSVVEKDKKYCSKVKNHGSGYDSARIRIKKCHLDPDPHGQIRIRIQEVRKLRKCTGSLGENRTVGIKVRFL